MKFKVGDKVKVRNDLVVGDKYGLDYFMSDMEEFKDRNFIIEQVLDDKYILKNTDGWLWTDEMLETVEEKEMLDSVNEISKIELETNHPKHYNSNGNYETIRKMEIIFGKENTAMWARMTAFKYMDRMGHKDDVAKEQAKIDWYLAYAEKYDNSKEGL